MEYFELIKKRVSYRKEFTDAPVPKDDLIKIVEAGIYAPSGKNLQSTSFVVVTNDEMRAKIAELISTPATKTAPAILVLISEPIDTGGFGIFETEDYAAACENILLAITDLGYAGVWMDGMTRMGDNFKKIKDLLGLEDKFTVRTIIPVGVPAEEIAQPARKSVEERAIFVE